MKHEDAVKYSIVVPFYNERDNIRPLYSKIVETMVTLGSSFEMIFVDDGSQDLSDRTLVEICRNDSRLIFVRLRRNFGQTAALQAGFDFASGEIIIAMDGDLQHDPAEIPNFLAKMEEGYDIVSGWRLHRADSWLTRRLPSLIANWLMSKVSNVKVHDFGTTFKAYRREVIKGIQLYGELHRFIPALASGCGATIAEIPITTIPRQNGKSNYGLSRTFRVLLDLLNIKFLLDYSTRPLQFFGGIGLLASCLGTVIAGFLLFAKFGLGRAIMLQHGPLLFMATTLILSGIQFLSIGLMGEMLSRTYHETQRKPIYVVREVRNWPAHLSAEGLVAEPEQAAPTNYQLWPNDNPKDKQMVR